MLRYILIKLPGLTCISDAPVSSPCHVRMLRSLSPVKPEYREDRGRNCFPKHLYKRSYSYPSARPKTENSSGSRRGLYCGTNPQDTKCEQVIHRRELSQKMRKPSTKQTGQVESEKPKGRTQKPMNHSKEFLLSENEIDEKFFDTYEVSEQYELEAAKPRRSQSELTFNVFELMEKQERRPNPVEHLQPNNLKPFGSTENDHNPTLMKSKSSTFFRFPPGYEEPEQVSADKKHKRSEDIQHREYSTSSKAALFRLEDHVEMIKSLPPISVSKYDVIRPPRFYTPNIGNIEQKQSEGDLTNIKSRELNKLDFPFKNDSEMNPKEPFKLPWTENDSTQSHASEPDEKSVSVIKKPLETPWPSYADRLKSSVNENDIKSVKSTTQPNIIESASDPIYIDRLTSSTEKLQQIGKQTDDNFVRRPSFLQKTPAVSQKRTLSTEPLVTLNSTKYPGAAVSKMKPVKLTPQEKYNIQSKKYSRKSRPLEPESCEKEKPPDKCFLPSKIRLKPSPCTPKPKPCPKEEPCVRADDCLKIEPKRLPKIAPSPCPCIEPDVPDINPRLKRLQMKFQDPPRECPCETCPCPSRADDSLVEKPKKLLPLKAGECVCVEPPPMVDVPLKRLQKVCIPEEKCNPIVECPKPEPCIRADDSLEVCEKTLPKLKVSPCPCIEQPIPDKNPKIRRLKFKFKDPPRICPCEPICPCPPRADDNIIEKSKKLPLYIPGDCACIESPQMIDVPLKRLQKVCIPEEKCYPKEECVKLEPCIRADDCLKIEEKTLPVLKPSDCVCREPFIPDKVPKMKRLEMVFEDEPKIRPCEPEYSCSPRADDTVPQKIKKLPQLIAGECPCVESAPLIDVPLKRLQKVCVPEEKCKPRRKCPPPEPCIRADDDYCEKLKELPKLEAKVCPCIEEPPMKEAPVLKRLNLKVPEPPKVCPKPCTCEVDCPRADDQMKDKKKPLPILRAGDCPCIDRPMVDVGPLKRLKCEEEPEECVTVDPCIDIPRADMGCWEYWTPEKPKCKSGDKTKKKRGVSVNAERKFNTDSRVELFDEMKKIRQNREQTESHSMLSKEPQYEKNNLGVDFEEFNRVSDVWKEKNGWVIKKQPEIIYESPKNHVSKNPLLESTPTVFLLKKLISSEQEKYNKSICNAEQGRNLDVKKVMNAAPSQNDNQSTLSLPNVRNLSTDAQALGMVRNKSTNRKVPLPKKSKDTVKKKSVCHKIGETCELNSKLPCVSEKSVKTCEKPYTPVSCDKKPPPYPAFSEVMEEEVEPFSEATQWTCNRQEFGFYPRYKKLNNPFKADKDKKNYTTTTLIDNLIAVQVPSKSNGKEYVAHPSKNSNNSGESVMSPILKKRTHNVSDFMDNSTYLLTNIDYVPKKFFHCNNRTCIGAIGTSSTSPKIFCVDSNSPLNSRIHKCMQPQYSLQIVRGICFNRPRKSSTITKTVSYRRDSTFSKKEKSKKCEKEKKKKCPKFQLQNCPPPQIRPKCKEEHPVICDKSEAPYPAFTDCLDEELAENLSECPLEVEKIRQLQPRYIQPLDKPKLVKPVVPILGTIDLKKEEACIKEKLCIENKGLSQTCDQFGKFQKPMRAKHYINDQQKHRERIEKLKKQGKWPPKNSRGICTSTGNIILFQRRNVCKYAKGLNNIHSLEEFQDKDVLEKIENTKKIHTLFHRNVKVRDYHILCMEPMKKLSEHDNKMDEVPHHVLTEDDSCRFRKLRNVQWRINNFQKWHRLNKLSSLPGYEKRFFSSMDPRNRCVFIEHGRKSFSTSATNMVSPCETLDMPMHRGISTTFILAGTKKSEIKYIHVRKEKKSPKVSKSCPKLTLKSYSYKKHTDFFRRNSPKKNSKKQQSPYTAYSDSNYTNLTSNIDECPVMKEQIERLQPQYQISPEIETPSATSYTFQDKLDPSIEAEYARQKYGIENVGLTQHCSNFGEKIKPLRVRLAAESLDLDKSKEMICRDHSTSSIVVPDCGKIREVPNVRFCSSAEVENITRVNISNNQQSKCDMIKGKKTPEDLSQCIETKVCQQVKVTIPSSYKTCPEPPQYSQITEKIMEEQTSTNCHEPEGEPASEKKVEHGKRQSQIDCPGFSPNKCSNKISLWQKIANYFKARPNCPAPDEWKKKAARVKAEKYAKVAGLVVVDPKELPPKRGKCTQDDLPTVITHQSCYSQKKSMEDSGKKSFSTTAITNPIHSKCGNIWCQDSLSNGNVSRNRQILFQTSSEGDISFNSNDRKHSNEEHICRHSKTINVNKSSNYSFHNNNNDDFLGEADRVELHASSEVGQNHLEAIEQQNDDVKDEFFCEYIHMNTTVGHNGLFMTSLCAIPTDEVELINIDENKSGGSIPEGNECEAIHTVTQPHTMNRIYSSKPELLNNNGSLNYLVRLSDITSPNYRSNLDEINKALFGTSPVLTFSKNTCENCSHGSHEKMKKGIGLSNGKSPFITMMRRYYSKNANCRNLEEINESLEEEEKKKIKYTN
nr:uncharacterized protein LOC111504731 [Leptinotarsa decemlineata]